MIRSKSSAASTEFVLAHYVGDQAAFEALLARAHAEPLARSGQFPPTVTEMISVAEESNTLDSVLISIADGLERRTSRKLDLMVRLLEPLMLMVMAIIILFIVIALRMPVLNMGSAFA